MYKKKIICLEENHYRIKFYVLITFLTIETKITQTYVLNDMQV